MKNQPLVSIIVPVYNVEKYLIECLDSIVNQTYENLEIILVDDGSPDSSGHMCDDYAKKDDRIKVVHKDNEGLNFARKSGFEVSTGEWFAFVDSDDVLDRRYIEALLDANILHNTELSICGYSSFVNDLRPDESPLFNKVENVDKITRLYLIDARPEGKFYLQTAWSKLFSRRIIESVDWDLSNYRSNEDEIMSIFYYKDLRGGVSFVDSGLYHYRQNPDSIMTKAKVEYKNSYQGKAISKLEFLDDVYNKRLEAFGDGYSEEIAYFFSLHFMVHINKEHRKDPRYRLSTRESELYDSKLDAIKRASERYEYHDEYGDIAEFINKSGSVKAFFDYRKINPLISVIVPIYNSARYLEQCIDSILNQSYWNLEIILVNDGSTDSSKDICDRYVRQDERVRAIHRGNAGVSVARNIGIKESSGEYVIFVDSDDFISPEAISRLVAAWRKEGGKPDITIGDVSPYHSIGYSDTPPDRQIPVREMFAINQPDFDNQVAYELLTSVNSVYGKLIKKKLLIDKDVLFPEGIKIAEDLVFIAKAFFLAKSIYFIGDSIYFYRADYLNEHSAIGKVSNKKAFDFGKALKMICEFMKESKRLKRAKDVSLLKRVVIAHCLYALDIVEKDHDIHREVYNYIRDDVFVYFDIGRNNDDVSNLSQQKVDLILSNNYDQYLLVRLNELKFALFTHLDSKGVLRVELDKNKQSILNYKSQIDSLKGEIAYLKSPRGMVRTPAGKILRYVKRLYKS